MPVSKGEIENLSQSSRLYSSALNFSIQVENGQDYRSGMTLNEAQ
jgi:hypothetical protein